MQRKWAIIAAVALGLLAVFLTNLYFQQKEAGLRREELQVQKVRVLVAAKDISRGATIDYDMLAFKVIPANFVQPRALTSRESAVGKTALVTIVAGEQVLSTKLAAPGSGLTLAVKTPPGKRAFTIGLNATAAVGGMIRPGDHVDVLAVLTNPAITLTLFQDILILAVGQEMVAEETDRTKREERGSSSTSRGTVTMALMPQEVQIITVAMQHGKISLTLRPRMEKGQALPSVDLSNLPPAIDLSTLHQLYIRQPSQRQTGVNVEVIRGLQKEITSVPIKE